MEIDSTNISHVVFHKVGLIEEYGNKAFDWAKVFIPNLLFAILALVIGLWVIKWVARLAVKAMERRKIEVSLRTFLKSLIGIGLKVVLFILVAGMLGVQTTSFVAILGAAGLAVGLALQGSLSNFAGGVLILIFKPYKVGDTIEALAQKGEVKEIQIFNTILLTGDHRTIILPNGAVSNGFIINHSKQGSLRSDINLSVSDEHEWTQIKGILQNIIESDSRILQSPAASVSFVAYCPGGYDISVKVFSTPGEAPVLKGDVTEMIRVEFDKNKISVPKPVMKQITLK